MVQTNRTRWKYDHPRAENMLRMVGSNIISNLRNGNPAKINLAPLIERAYRIVNETGVLQYGDYSSDVSFLEDVDNG